MYFASRSQWSLLRRHSDAKIKHRRNGIIKATTPPTDLAREFAMIVYIYTLWHSQHSPRSMFVRGHSFVHSQSPHFYTTKAPNGKWIAVASPMNCSQKCNCISLALSAHANQSRRTHKLIQQNDYHHRIKYTAIQGFCYHKTKAHTKLRLIWRN